MQYDFVRRVAHPRTAKIRGFTRLSPRPYTLLHLDSMEWVMGELMIRCPKTGKPVTTGIHLDRARFRSMIVFFSSSYCPSCGTLHQWFARDAWMCEPEAEMSDPTRDREVA